MHDAGQQTVLAARNAAESLGIPLIEEDVTTIFRNIVLDSFLNSYLNGKTPNPCLICNPNVKFHTLLSIADRMGIEHIATGHYVSASLSSHGNWAIKRGAVRRRDQSYALAGLRPDQIRRCLFPLGKWHKDDVRHEANVLGLAAGQKDDSQDICFLPEGDYAGYLRARGVSTGSGPILNRSGDILGKHGGLEGYTVGQRKGLGIAAERPLYVLELEPTSNSLLVGFEQETYSPALRASGVNWMGMARRQTSFDCRVQIRYRHEAASATVTCQDDTLHVQFSEPQRSVAPGQWAVGYDDDDCILFGSPIVAG
jgi:tRNA-specific 2-thiouridylase